MRPAKVLASLRIRAVSPEPILFAHINSRPRANFSQGTRHVALLRGRASALKDWCDGKSKKPFLDTWFILKQYKNCLTLFIAGISDYRSPLQSLRTHKSTVDSRYLKLEVGPEYSVRDSNSLRYPELKQRI